LELYKILANETQEAFKKIAQDIEEDIYGFGLFTDDSATYVDIAINTTDSLMANLEKLKNPRQKKLYGFEYKWYTTQWHYEGGFSNLFPKTNELMGQDDTSSDKTNVFESLIKALKLLRSQDVFKSNFDDKEIILMISISDSQYDEEYMERSIKELNTKAIYEEYLKDRKDT